MSVYVIGVVHQGNRKINHRILTRKIEDIQPDIVFWEQSEPFKRVFGLMTAWFLRIARPPVEQLALQTYSRRHPGVPILGFDTSFPSKKKYIRQWVGNDDAVHDSLWRSRMTPDDSTEYAEYANLNNQYLDAIMHGTLEGINSPDVYELERSITEMNAGKLLRLADKYVTDRGLVQAFRDQVSFSMARNAYMASCIEALLTRHGSSKAVVLTGVSHKYYLMEKLSRNPRFALQSEISIR